MSRTFVRMTTDRHPVAGVMATDVADARRVLDAAADVLSQLPRLLAAVSSSELGPLMIDVDRVGALVGAGRVAITAEADGRGDIAVSSSASVGAWVAEHCLSPYTGQSYSVAKCAGLLQREDLHGLPDAVLQADVTPGLAVAIAKNFDSISDLLVEGAHAPVLEAMITAGAEGGPGAVRQLRDYLLATHGQDEAFDQAQNSRKKLLDLSPGREINGTMHLDLVLDSEGFAVFEAAIGPLSAPRPDRDTAEPDLRPAGRRRAEALIEVCRRAVAAGADAPSTTKAQLLVTMTLDDLRAGIGAGVTLGSRDAGALLAPGTVRKLACDAGIIPIVLGTDSEVLDVGHRHRLFQPGQLKALWLRDRHCTFPGCSTPAHWADAHHLRHWIDGGPTNLDNAALLCARHHTIVHRDLLAGRIVEGQVAWDRKPNSYRPNTYRTDVLRA